MIFRVTASGPIRARAYPTAPIIRAAHVGEALPGEMVAGLSYHGISDWARVTLPSGVVGFIWTGIGAWEATV